VTVVQRGGATWWLKAGGDRALDDDDYWWCHTARNRGSGRRETSDKAGSRSAEISRFPLRLFTHVTPVSQVVVFPQELALTKAVAHDKLAVEQFFEWLLA
jgi:hypothetical protein